MAATKQQLVARTATRRFSEVTLSDDVVVRVRSMTVAEDRAWRKSWLNKKGEVDSEKWLMRDDTLVASTLCDDEGNTLFTVDEALKGIFDEWDVSDKRALAEAASKLIEPKKIDDALKNSDETAGNTSSGA